MKDISRNKTRLFSRAKHAAKDKGFRYVAAVGVTKLRRRIDSLVTRHFWYNYYRLFSSLRTFEFQREKYRYFIHKYNTTWRNERAVEIPIILRMIGANDGEILEVGNVLSHYSEIRHQIVDKYEKAAGVVNEDVTEIQTSKQYDLIISISTLEHVGWDENAGNQKIVNDSEKILRALEKLRELLKPKGKIVVTVPIGYNPHLDKLLRTGKLEFDKVYAMKRALKGSRWIETEPETIKTAKFNRQVPTANAILIGIIENKN
jgi:SAM-dependent methyltransferase